MKITLLYGIVLMLLAGCAAPNNKSIAIPVISLSQFETGYQKSCNMAIHGNLDAMREVLNATGTLDGELAFTHGMNLVALRASQPKHFDAALSQIAPQKANLVHNALSSSERTLQLMAGSRPR